MNVAIVKYNAGNIYSVVNALKRLGISPVNTDNAELLTGADKELLPGQGEAGTAMGYLKAKGLDRLIPELKQPVLGICVGQQLMCRHSEESDTDCLGIIDAEVKRFISTTGREKIPAIGWNSLYDLSDDLFKGIADNEYVYFVHSYYVPVCKYTIAKADHIHPFSAAVRHKNFYATQFHPEKSGSIGATILQNFIGL